MPSKISRLTASGWVQVADLDAININVAALVDLDNRVDAVELSLPPGVMQIYCGVTEPVGWFFCHGTLKIRASYPQLFGAIGTRFNTGGEDSSNFRLPDMRGRFPVGVNTAGQPMSIGVGERYGTFDGQVHPHTHDMKNHVHHINHYHGNLGRNTGDDAPDHYHGSAGGLAGLLQSVDNSNPIWILQDFTSGSARVIYQGTTHWAAQRHQHAMHPNTQYLHEQGSGGVGGPPNPSTSGDGNSWGPTDNTTDGASGAVSGSNANIPPAVSFNYIVRAV